VLNFDLLPLKYLFIYHTFDVLGGVQTLMARMSDWLVRNGHQVTILVNSASKAHELLPASVACIPLGREFNSIFYNLHARSIWRRLGLQTPDVIKSFDLSTSWAAFVLAGIMRPTPKVVAGFYTPNEFDYQRISDRPIGGYGLFVRNLFKNIHAGARLTCDTTIITEAQERFGKDKSFVFWPLPVNVEAFEGVKRNPVWGRLVSIGRLAPMKEYNLHTIDLVRKLRLKGYDVKWTVYGSGSYEPEMRNRIASKGLGGVIELKGDVPYQEFGRVLEGAYVFVGMGTSVIEASLCRVPSVVAVPYDGEGRTYGPLHRVPLASDPEFFGNPDRTIEDEVVRVLRLSEVDYRKEAELGYIAAQTYSLPSRMQEFQRIVEQTPVVRADQITGFYNYLYALARRARVGFGAFSSL
jgi:glycosyltransferase involved in cell wall biosynthesis